MLEPAIVDADPAPIVEIHELFAEWMATSVTLVHSRQGS